MNVVLDAGVVLAGASWRNESHLCLVAFARRRIQAYATLETLDELRTVAARLKNEFKHSPWTILHWYCDRVHLAQPMPLGKQRSRDSKDDPDLSCALAAGAKIIVSRDAGSGETVRDRNYYPTRVTWPPAPTLKSQRLRIAARFKLISPAQSAYGFSG